MTSEPLAALPDPLSGIYCYVINEPQMYNRVSLDKNLGEPYCLGYLGGEKEIKLVSFESVCLMRPLMKCGPGPC